MNYTKEQLFEKFQSLPDDIRESFLSVDTLKVLNQIVIKYRLHADQAGVLSEQVGLLMLGATKPQDFLLNIQHGLQVPIETAGEIVKEINAKIFFPIRESLKKIHHPEEGAKYEPEAAPKVENFSPAGQVTEGSFRQEKPINTGNNAVIVNENPPAEKPRSDRNIFDEKMSKLFRLPKEEVEIRSAKAVAPATPAQSAASADPYREMP